MAGINSDLNENELLENQQGLAEQAYSRSMYNPQLMALRAQLPFLHIVPFTNQVSTYKLSAGVVQNIELPSGAKLVRFSGDGAFILSRGTASLPTGEHRSGECGIVSPFNTWYWIAEISSLSVISRLGCDLSAEFFVQL